jgi:hypothetical protein
LSGEDSIKSACRKMNQASHFGRKATPEDIREAHRRSMTERRKYFTGSEDIGLTEAEQKDVGKEEPLGAFWG